MSNISIDLFCPEVYKLTSNFSESEKFGLTNQLGQASVSIPSNITVGSSKKSNKDYPRFLEITHGASYKIETQLLIAVDLNFISKLGLHEISKELEEIIRMIFKFRSTPKI